MIKRFTWDDSSEGGPVESDWSFKTESQSV